MKTLKSVISRCNLTFCESDPFPMKSIKDAKNFDTFLESVLEIVNLSLSQGVFPDSEKCAYVRPHLKAGSERQDFKSYRPVSNVSVISKIIEKVVQQQLLGHLRRIDALPKFQSAYRKHFSTETSLLSVANDITWSMNESQCTALVLLDFSSAFDTVVHSKLIEDLQDIGVAGKALQWFNSYLSDRTYCVTVNNAKSEVKRLERGVPQGSVLGPLLFTLYTTEISWLLESHGVKYMLFADDTQYYFILESEVSANDLIRNISNDLSNLLIRKRLKLNPDKTVHIKIGTVTALKKFNTFESVLQSGAAFQKTAKDLGVILDEKLSYTEHINKLVKTCNFHLSNIQFMKKYLTHSMVQQLIFTLVINRLDNNNSLYVGLPDYKLNKIQKIFNRAARILTGHPYRLPITPTLIRLHWLPIKARIEFKICVLTFKILRYKQPEYLHRLLVKSQTGCVVSTRCDTDPHHLNVPRVRTSAGTRSFGYAAPRYYNALPVSIKSSESLEIFKNKLKTFIFGKCYDLQEKRTRDPYRTH